MTRQISLNTLLAPWSGLLCCLFKRMTIAALVQKEKAALNYGVVAASASSSLSLFSLTIYRSGFFRFTLLVHVPFLPVIQNRVFAPDFLRCFAAHSFEEFCGARPGPILPFVSVSVMRRIVVNVIHGSPEMAVRFDLAVKAIVPDLSPAAMVFAIPFE